MNPGCAKRIEAMFGGEKINSTEKRAVLHVALRAPAGETIVVDGQKRRAGSPCRTRQDGRQRAEPRKGHTGERIKNIVNIGVVAYEALRHYSERSMTFRFVSNVDGIDFVENTRDLNPAETLFIISSKTFTTMETMTNAQQRPATGCCRGDSSGGGQNVSWRFRPTPRKVSAFGRSTRPTGSGIGSAAGTRMAFPR